MNFHPRGVEPGATLTRFADVAPSSYSKKDHTVEAVISLGSPVARYYGTEKLRISASAVDLSRMDDAGIPLLDSHNQHGIDNHLGRLVRTWFGKSNGKSALLGLIKFNDTERGRQAEGMVARGEIAGISAGYTVRDWEITDAKGNVIDPETTRISLNDDLTFTATRWSLLEASLVTVPADQAAMVRSMGGKSRREIVGDIRARMRVRQRMIERHGRLT
jgi:phage head maturation protease